MTAPEILLDGRVSLYLGDVLAVLKTLPEDSVDCVVTSPPYWGLRDYGVDGQIGLEPTLAEHLAVMVAVFEEVRRVLKPDGTLWLNYGDCYASSPNGRSAADTKEKGADDRTFRDKPFSTVGPIYDPAAENGDRRGSGDCLQKRNEGSNHTGRVVAGGYLKPKDLCMIPNRLAIALQDAGWWVRSEIIWGKPNPMPESIKDRPATAHEKIWLLTKSARYFYDADVVRQAATKTGTPGHLASGKNSREKVRRTPNAPDKFPSGWASESGSHKPRDHNKGTRKQDDIASSAASAGASSGRRMAGLNERWVEKAPHKREPGRNLRNYEPPPMLEPAAPDVWRFATAAYPDAHFATFPPELAVRCITAGCPKDGLVLDPFGGAGTTALAALMTGRRAALIELNPDYAAIAKNRLEQAVMGPDERRRARAAADPHAGPLFSNPQVSGG
ncbi:MAG: site-specific DNA-methyltransferase [Roseibium sp.]|nr:site-specific DNA-methyltransferase [Roseibium sp.]